eukprot:gene10828-34235_t
MPSAKDFTIWLWVFVDSGVLCGDAERRFVYRDANSWRGPSGHVEYRCSKIQYIKKSSQIHSSVGLRINTGDGDWLERPPYPAATGKDSTVWSVSMPPTPPPPTGGWVGNGNVPYNGNPCAVERSNQGFIIISGAEGTIGATATQSWVCLAPPASFGRVTTTNFVWTAAPPPPNALYKWIIDGAEEKLTDETSARCQDDGRNVDLWGTASTVTDIRAASFGDAGSTHTSVIEPSKVIYVAGGSGGGGGGGSGGGNAQKATQQPATAYSIPVPNPLYQPADSPSTDSKTAMRVPNPLYQPASSNVYDAGVNGNSNSNSSA